jgi:hypothetical protein
MQALDGIYRRSSILHNLHSSDHMWVPTKKRLNFHGVIRVISTVYLVGAFCRVARPCAVLAVRVRRGAWCRLQVLCAGLAGCALQPKRFVGHAVCVCWAGLGCLDLAKLSGSMLRPQPGRMSAWGV